MASILRQIVAGPRARHPEAGLDLCYVTDYIVVTSGPSHSYPQRAYRNPLDDLVKFLDSKHGDDWAIWEFRAEGTGYPDDLVYNRVRHYPWPDHHPPPFRLVPLIMASMKNWLHGGDLEQGGSKQDNNGGTKTLTKERHQRRVAVVHCKAGKGRSGTMTCSYLISQEGWKPEDALQRFTERRMRPMFGAGVTIPSQLRWISYVDRWTRHGKLYRDGPVEILEIHVWGLRDGVKLEVEGFVNEGKKIHVFHTFKKDERVVVEGDAPGAGGWSDMVWDLAGYPTGSEAPAEADYSKSTNNEVDGKASEEASDSANSKSDPPPPTLIDGKQRAATKLSRSSTTSSRKSLRSLKKSHSEPGGKAVIFRPHEPIKLDHSDVNISVERRNKTHKSIGLTMVSSVAHVWFNTFFEGQGPEQEGKPKDEGVFAIEWEAMDGIKGSGRKGARALDRIAVVWRAADKGEDGVPLGEAIATPDIGEHVPQAAAAEWTGPSGEDASPEGHKKLGLRVQSGESADVTRASSVQSAEDPSKENDATSMEGLKTSGPTGEELPK